MTERPSDTALNGANRINEAKLNNVLQKDELTEEVILIGDIYANGLQNNKVAEDPESFKSFIPNTNPFKFPHKGLEEAAKTVNQSIDAAIVNAPFLSETPDEVKENESSRMKVLIKDMDDAA